MNSCVHTGAALRPEDNPDLRNAPPSHGYRVRSECDETEGYLQPGGVQRSRHTESSLPHSHQEVWRYDKSVHEWELNSDVLCV